MPRYYLAIFLIFIVLTGCGATLEQAYPLPTPAPSQPAPEEAVPEEAAPEEPVPEPEADPDPTNPAPAPSPTRAKKLIEYSWAVPTAEYIRDNISRMEKRPFDGLAFRIGKRDYISYAFDAEAWSEADMQLDILADINWNSFTDNFLIVWANSEGRWFDEAHWRTVTANTRLMSKALAAAGAKGIFFDPEYYGAGPCSTWRFETYDVQDDKPACDYAGRSFEEVEDKVRERGRQYIDALESATHELNLISLHSLQQIYESQRWANIPVKESKYALLLAFTEGMLQGADASTRIIDGHESAYYFDDTRQFSHVYNEAEKDVPSLLSSPELVAKFATTMDSALAISTDCTFVTEDFTKVFSACNKGFSEADKGRWLEQNVYHALLHADEYAWIYSEAGYHPNGYDTQNRMDWYSDPPAHVPPGAEDAIRRAKAKLETNEALGFNFGRIGERIADRSIPVKFMAAPQLELSMSPSDKAAAEVKATSGDVEKLELYVDSVLTEELEPDTLPVTFDVADLEPGTHTLFVRGFNNAGFHTVSNPVTFTLE